MKNPKVMDESQTLNLKPKVGMTISLADREWVEIVGTIKDANSSNSTKVKLFGDCYLVSM
jgi:hypothetical protein